MTPIAQWLGSLGLSEYADRFAESRIDLSILQHLTDQDLKDIGVVLGDRRRILRAIAELAGTIAATPQLAAAPESKPRDEAERRQVTVMFSDLVGSTTLAARMDPEDLREIVSAFHKCIAEIVDSFGGFVAQYMGDGVLVYFGYPQAQEDDAERAVRTGLALTAALAGLKTRAPLRIRVGIATGLVVVGDLIGSGEAQEHGIVGETPNLAARLQDIAEPGTVVIAEGTRTLLGNLFEFEDLGLRSLKGFPGPVRAWAVLRASSVPSRFEALHTAGLTALVGREEESKLLLQRWSEAKTGEGQVVLLSGEPGIGKSRLTVALLECLADEPHTRLRYFCSSRHASSALYPIIGQMERAVGLEHDDTPQTRLDKLDAMLAKTSSSMQDSALFAEMLSLPNDGRYPALELSAQQRRERTLDALNLQIETLSRSSPVLMIFEDVHWIDPTSLEALGRAVDRVRTLRVLLIVTCRPEFEPSWIGRPHVTVCTIGRLAQRDVDAMIDQVVGNKPMPVSIRRDIIERTDGIPLFVEEMTKAVLETESEDEARRTAAFIPSSAQAVPATLHASLMARLDRLGPAKELAQIGAAIGRSFSHALLAAVVSNSEAELRAGLDRLIQAGLLYRQGVPPRATYLFKHALVQDAAYGTLLRVPRGALHARIANTLESQFAEITENQPELLAGHCTQAGQIEKAAGLWGKAGQRSLARSALVEASEQFKRALDQIATLPTTPALRREEIKIQVALITPLFHVKGYAAPESKGAVERARLLIEQAEALGESPEDPLLLFSVLYGRFVTNLIAFNGDVCRDLAAHILALAEKQGVTVPLMIGHRVMGVTLVHTGHFEESRKHLDRAIALYDPVEHRALASRFGSDSRVTILGFRSLAFWCLGHPEAALTDADRAIVDAREIGQAATLMLALFTTTWTQIFCGNYSVARLFADELVALAGEKGAAGWKSMGLLQQCDVLVSAGKASVTVQGITAGLTALRSTGTTTYVPWGLSRLARAHADLGLLDDAWRSVDEAMKAVEVTKERMFEAEINRVAGEIALMSPKRDAARAQVYFEHALAVAREQQAKSWELRAAMSMTRLWRDQGKRRQARGLLASVYDWFTEGFDTLDLKEARGLLDTLGS
jgi:class 3 adenylate cyclase/predicted ATPase